MKTGVCRVGLLVFVVCLAACSSGGGKQSTPTTANVAAALNDPVGFGYAPKPAPSTTTTAPPDVVNGIPLRRLAALVRVPAIAESEPHPFNIRLAVGSDRAANALMGRDGESYNFGDPARAYVVALDGHFSCDPPKCEGSPGPPVPPGLAQSPTTTTVQSPVSISTMLLTFDPKTLQEVGGFRLVGHEVDMNRLGRVYSLDRYR